MKKHIFTLFIVFLLTYSAESQEGNWDIYIAQYNAGAGSTVLNTGLVNYAPVKELPFIVITGVTYDNCNDDGFPMKDEFDKLYEIEDGVATVISSLTRSEHAGTFTYQCERLNYIYVSDTSTIRMNLIELYEKKYQSYNYHINIKSDSIWDTYLKFLYPNEEIQEYMSNQKVIMQLQSAGDDLSKERKVDHWIFFTDKKSRKLFTAFVKTKGFKIENTDKIKDKKSAYQLHISRTDYVDIDSISKLTLELRKKAAETGGTYDGWETFVIK